MTSAVSPSLVRPVHLVPSQGAALSPLFERLRREMRGDVYADRASRGRYATDASIYQIMPLGVVVPRDQDDLRIALDIARDRKIPVLARGAGTSQCGQTVGEALVVDNSKWLNRIVAFDAQARTVTVEPGIVLDHLNAWLKPHGLWFPVDVSTAAQCTIGGMAGNNSCGSRSIEYGNMVHNVLAIDAILADGSECRFGSLAQPVTDRRMLELLHGVERIAKRERDEIVERVPKVLRRVAGYNLDLFDCQNPRAYTDDGHANLAHLLVGSEGTLAHSRQITLKLAPLPAHKTLGVVNFPTFYQAMDTAQHIVKLKPVAVELVDRTMIDLSMENPAFRPVIEQALVGQPRAILLVEFAGESRDAQHAQLDRLAELMADLGLPGSVVKMTDAGAQKALWEVRKAGLNIMMSMKGDGKPVSFIEDCAVPLEHLAEYTRRLTDVFHRHETEGTWYAHASVGTLHVRPILDMRRDGATRMREIAEEAAALVREYKGAYSGEHGDGLCRGEWVAWQYGPRLNAAFAEIKTLFDPDNRFNPDKIVNPPKMDAREHFRFAPGYAALPLRPALDWSAWNVARNPLTGEETAPGSGTDITHGLASAVEMCNNNGHCRKFDAGTMCPSYRVTRDEQHVTRGRANTLRLAVTGQLGADGLAGDDVKAALDLCVSCKGCKRDCRRASTWRASRSRRGMHGTASTARHCVNGSSRICRVMRRGPRACAARSRSSIACRSSRRRSSDGSASRRSVRCPGSRGRFWRIRGRGRVHQRLRKPARPPAKCCCSSIRSATTRNRTTRAPRRPCSKRPATPCISTCARARGHCAAAARSSRPGSSTKRSPRPGARSMRCGRTSNAVSQSSGWSLRACCRCATSFLPTVTATKPHGSRATRSCSRSFSCANTRPAGCRCRCTRSMRTKRSCTATAIKRRSARSRRCRRCCAGFRG